MAPITSILGILNQPPGALAYHVILLFALEAMCGMAWEEWRRMRRQEYRQMTWGFLGAAAIHVLWAALEGLRWRGAIPAETLSWLWPPLSDALYALSWAALIWSFLPLLQAFGSKLPLIGWAAAGAIGVFFAIAALIWRSALLASPAAQYGSHWLAYAWAGLRIALAWLALYAAIRRGAELRLWLGIAFAALLAGQVAQLAHALSIGHEQAAGWLRVAELVAYPLLALTVHQSIIADLFSYGQEFKTVSEESLRQTRELLLLVETSKATNSLELGKVMEGIVENVVLALNADQCGIAYATSDPGVLQVMATYDPLHGGLTSGANTPGLALEVDAFPIVKHALERRQQILSNRVESNPAAQELFQTLGSSDTGPMILQPLASATQVLGLLLVGNSRSKRPFSQADGHLCQSLAGQVAASLENAQLHQDLANQVREQKPPAQAPQAGSGHSQEALESVPYGLLFSDASNRVTSANAAAARILGQSRDQLLRKDILSFFPSLPAVLRSGKQTLAQALQQDEREALTTISRIDGQTISASLVPLIEQGQPAGIVAIVQDITHEAEAERAKSDFIATASRELREPLTSMRGYADLLLQEVIGPLNPAQVRFVEKTRHNTVRMSELVDDLIDISEIGPGLAALHPQPTDVAEIITAATAGVQELVEEKKLTLNFAMQEGLPPALADRDALIKIVGNLLDNACKYTPEGGEIHVRAEARDDDQGGLAANRYLLLSVQDSGVGIPLEEQRKILERFYKAENPLMIEAGGSGLGLAIAKALVEAHQGRIWVQSEPDLGSTFYVALPIVEAQQPASNEQREAA
ncbi:MAG: PAS domain S-box protein [Chloroflexi bacterium]|nr:PAS domain S-box protein [Chloroflexota bacterium]